LKNKVNDVDDDVLRSLPSQTAIKQRVTRKRKKNKIQIKEPVDFKSLVVPDQYKKSYRGKLFLIDDSKDDDRVLLFLTDDNLNLLSKHRNWLGDGTFKILQLRFLQNFFKHVRKMEFYIMYLTDTHVKQCFLFLQALAFLPSLDVFFNSKARLC
jgi:hypothetical protein